MAQHAHASRIPALEPLEAFAQLAGRADVFWLDSSLPRERDGRFSIMGCEPRSVFSCRDDQWKISGADIGEQGASGALERLDALLDVVRITAPAHAAHLPFFGGAVGWLSYDLGRRFESIAGTAVDDLRAPDIYIAWYDAAIVWDHLTAETWVVAVDADGAGNGGASAARDRLLQALRQELTGTERALRDRILDRESSTVPPPAARAVPVRSDMSREDYMQRVATVRDGIAHGEFYQLNLVQRFSCAHEESPAATYVRLRTLNPAPFAAYIAAADCTVLSSSPERFLEVSVEGDVRTCPIKGTRARGATDAADAAHRAELLASSKEKAELLMIVDLLRNDLGRVCVPGSVAVERLHALESFATVHHLVGEVRGRLRSDVTRRDLLRAVFPGGSITGAPKVSAMRAIDRLEPHRRGIGMGAIGYFSAHGRIDLNIAIRTIVNRGGVAYMPVGAGIVWDSDPAAEYAETLAKARALFTALGVREVET